MLDTLEIEGREKNRNWEVIAPSFWRDIRVTLAGGGLA